MEFDCDVDLLMERSIEAGILPGIRMDGNCLLMAATEMQTREDVDCLVEIYKSVCEN